MKLALIVLLLTSSAYGANVITNPSIAGDNDITATSNSIQALTVTGISPSLPAASFTNNSGWDGVQGISQDGAGVYGVSTNFTGIYGGSANSNSGYFQSEYSGNTQATLLIQKLGGSANLLETQDASGSRLSSIDASGVVHASKALQLDTASLSPSCNSSNRGLMYVAQGGAGVADALKICMKDAAGNYSFVTK